MIDDAPGAQDERPSPETKAATKPASGRLRRLSFRPLTPQEAIQRALRVPWNGAVRATGARRPGRGVPEPGAAS